ncbi:MAG TPA: hypothetical protein VHT03_09760 [Rhizomicrobium sp.]|jgi:hypothetical protein|nr:hypothetical protein [Rhizomicrobium sp.]
MKAASIALFFVLTATQVMAKDVRANEDESLHQKILEAVQQLDVDVKAHAPVASFPEANLNATEGAAICQQAGGRFVGIITGLSIAPNIGVQGNFLICRF